MVKVTSLIGGNHLRIMGSVVLHWEFGNSTFLKHWH